MLPKAMSICTALEIKIGIQKKNKKKMSNQCFEGNWIVFGRLDLPKLCPSAIAPWSRMCWWKCGSSFDKGGGGLERVDGGVAVWQCGTLHKCGSVAQPTVSRRRVAKPLTLGVAQRHRDTAGTNTHHTLVDITPQATSRDLPFRTWRIRLK